MRRKKQAQAVFGVVGAPRNLKKLPPGGGSPVKQPAKDGPGRCRAGQFFENSITGSVSYSGNGSSSRGSMMVSPGGSVRLIGQNQIQAKTSPIDWTRRPARRSDPVRLCSSAKGLCGHSHWLLAHRVMPFSVSCIRPNGSSTPSSGSEPAFPLLCPAPSQPRNTLPSPNATRAHPTALSPATQSNRLHGEYLLRFDAPYNAKPWARKP